MIINLFESSEYEILTKIIIVIHILGVPGLIMVGLAIYAIFSANGNVLHPALNNQTVIYNMLIIGAIISIWEFIYTLMLLKQRSNMQDKQNT